MIGREVDFCDCIVISVKGGSEQRALEWITLHCVFCEG